MNNAYYEKSSRVKKKNNNNRSAKSTTIKGGSVRKGKRKKEKTPEKSVLEVDASQQANTAKAYMAKLVQIPPMSL